MEQFNFSSIFRDKTNNAIVNNFIKLMRKIVLRICNNTKIVTRNNENHSEFQKFKHDKTLKKYILLFSTLDDFLMIPLIALIVFLSERKTFIFFIAEHSYRKRKYN